ncbi:MAG TPA: hypothetical protein VFD97_01980 [Acidimicrobiia bacterium]|nr:hypothetical protein [Acidimicrobiia bacterium]
MHAKQGESAGSDGNSRRARRYAAIVLAVFAALAVSLAVNAAWMHQHIFDTETFVETLAPLPQDRAVSNAIAMHAVKALTPGETLEGRVAEALPDRLGFLTPEFTGFVEEFVFDTTKRVVESEAFARIWFSTASRRAASTCSPTLRRPSTRSSSSRPKPSPPRARS